MDPYPTSPFEGQRYSYTPGNPVNYTDPSGMRHRVVCSTGAWGPYGRESYYGTYVVTSLLAHGILNCLGGIEQMRVRVCMVAWNGQFEVDALGCGPWRPKSGDGRVRARYHRSCPYYSRWYAAYTEVEMRYHGRLRRETSFTTEGRCSCPPTPLGPPRPISSRCRTPCACPRPCTLRWT